MTGDRPTTPGWHCHRCRSTSCRQRADSDTDHVGRVEYRPLLLTQPSSVSWLWSHTHWCPSQRPQEVMRVDGSANPTMPKDPAQYVDTSSRVGPGGRDDRCVLHYTISDMLLSSSRLLSTLCVTMNESSHASEILNASRSRLTLIVVWRADRCVQQCV